MLCSILIISWRSRSRFEQVFHPRSRSNIDGLFYILPNCYLNHLNFLENAWNRWNIRINCLSNKNNLKLPRIAYNLKNLSRNQLKLKEIQLFEDEIIIKTQKWQISSWTEKFLAFFFKFIVVLFQKYALSLIIINLKNFILFSKKELNELSNAIQKRQVISYYGVIIESFITYWTPKVWDKNLIIKTKYCIT